MTLAHPTQRADVGGAAAHAWLLVLAALWTVTLLTAALTAALPPLAESARELLRLRLEAVGNPPPSLARATAIAAHNVQTAGWPLLLPLVGAHRNRLTRVVADVAVAAMVAVNAIVVGLAIGSYGVSLLPYTPQLPLEWAGVALAPAAWLATRTADHRPPLHRLAAVMAVLLAAAAVVETTLVPHR